VQFGHPPVVEVLAAAHRVGKVDAPVVPIVDIAQRGGRAALGHDGVRLAKERLADHAHRHPGGPRSDGGPEAGAAGAHDQDVMGDCFHVGHQNSLQSVQMPIEQSRT
jgi:hypothetical protein